MVKNGLLGVAIVAVLGLALPIANLVQGPPEGAFNRAATHAHPALSSVLPLLTTKCANCHTTQGKRPFYAAWPGAKTLIERNVDSALRHLNLERLLSSPEPFPPALLLEIQRTLEEGDMPPAAYVALHWDGTVNEAEKRALLDWLRAELTQAQGSAPTAHP